MTYSSPGEHHLKPDPSYPHKRRRRRHHSVNQQTSPSFTSATSSSCFSSLILILLALSLPTLISAAPSCIRFASYLSINQLFSDGGPGTKVLLCPSKTYRLVGTIVFTAADQELATFGYPNGAERAVLRISGELATAIQGDCRRCARVAVRNLVIDGNRAKLGRIVDPNAASGLIVLGGNDGQTVSTSWISDPRGFTAIHVREGDKLSCIGAVIENNEIGPAGDEYEPEVDGLDPEMSPLGRPLADGISIACRDSFVRENTFYDNTDAAIVVYCSPGTLIQSNRITADRLSAMAGILLVDSTPFDGDYTGTTVKANIIDAASRIIRVGIGIGAAVWSDDTETILRGGTVVTNSLTGRYMGYGIAAAGLKGWTVLDNRDEAEHHGERSARCFDEPINPDPIGFLHWSKTISDTALQPGFRDQEFQYIVCIDGAKDIPAPPKHDPPPAPVPQIITAEPPPIIFTAEPPPMVPVSQPKAVEGGFGTGSNVMDDIIEHSQQRMLEAIQRLARRVNVLAVSARAPGNSHALEDPTSSSPELSASIAGLADRVDGLETRQRALVNTALNLRHAVKAWDLEMTVMSERQSEILLDVQHRLDSHLQIQSPSKDDQATDREHQSRLVDLSNRARLLGGMTLPRGEVASWAPVLRFVIAQGIFTGIVMWVRRWLKKRRDHSKVL